MAAMKPRTGDGPLEVTKEGRGIVMRVPLEGGGTALFDEAYVRESILDPKAKVARGFPPVMPTFKGQLSEEQILALISYIRSLTPTPEGKQPQ